MDGAAVAALLAGEADRAEVRAEAEAAQEMGVTGVPTFIIAGQYVLTGAQPVEVWEDVIGQLEAATPGVLGGRDFVAAQWLTAICSMHTLCTTMHGQYPISGFAVLPCAGPGPAPFAGWGAEPLAEGAVEGGF